MNESRLEDYLDHILRAATDACGFVDGLGREEFLADKRTQQAVIMSLVIIGEAATKIMDRHSTFVEREFRRARIGHPMAKHAWHAQSHRAWLF